MVLIEQIEALLNYLEKKPELALGHFNRTKEGRSMAKKLWAECAEGLNRITKNCPRKTPVEWRTFYNEYKHKLLNKVKINKGDINATGKRAPKYATLTPLQERLYDILGRDGGGRDTSPLPVVQNDPLFKVEYLNEESSANVNDDDDVSNEQVSREPGTSRRLSMEASPEHRPQLNHSQAHTSFSDQEHATLKKSLENFERMERKKLDIMQEQVRATNRLAAAIEKMHERLNEPLPVVKKKKRSQDSDATDD